MATTEDIEARRTRVALLVSLQGVASLGQLCQALSVSESTVRRDLETLEERGQVKRTYGGAVCTRYANGQRLGFADKQTTMLDQKDAIAREVAQMIAPGQTIILDGGTTCYRVAAALVGQNLCVVTNSVQNAELLYSDMAAEVTLIGGYLYPRTGVAIGATAEKQIEQIRATAVVMSCAAVGPEGAFNINQMMVGVQQKMMAAADRVILAVDHSKFNQHGLAKLCDISAPDVIVTDDGITDQQLAWLESAGPEIVVCPVRAGANIA